MTICPAIGEYAAEYQPPSVEFAGHEYAGHERRPGYVMYSTWSISSTHVGSFATYLVLAASASSHISVIDISEIPEADT